MRFDKRQVVLAAAIALPLAAAATTIGLADDAPRPDVPAEVRIGDTDPSATTQPTGSGSAPPTTTPTTTTKKRSAPPAEVVPPPPPIDDDDDDWDDNDDDGADSPDAADD